VTIVTALLCY